MSDKDDGVGFTPGPWAIFEHRDHSGIAIGPRYNKPYFTDGEVEHVCRISPPGRAVNDEERANAALIVRAVNAHDDLVEALERLLRLAENNVDRIDGIEHEVIINTRSVLKKARGE